jgi:polyribonucleotide nucleotidyltransferase
MPYGAFVEFLPGKQGLLHISEVSWKRLESMDGVLSEGDMVKVKLIGLDNKTGKFKLSRKVLMPKPEGARPDGPRPGSGREGRPEIRPQRQENKE